MEQKQEGDFLQKHSEAVALDLIEDGVVKAIRAQEMQRRIRSAMEDYAEITYGATIEDQAKTIEACVQALDPLADICGEGDEDFPDNTPVTISFGRTTHYAVSLGDLRKAQKAFTEAALALAQTEKAEEPQRNPNGQWLAP